LSAAARNRYWYLSTFRCCCNSCAHSNSTFCCPYMFSRKSHVFERACFSTLRIANHVDSHIIWTSCQRMMSPRTGDINPLQESQLLSLLRQCSWHPAGFYWFPITCLIVKPGLRKVQCCKCRFQPRKSLLHPNRTVSPTLNATSHCIPEHHPDSATLFVDASAVRKTGISGPGKGNTWVIWPHRIPQQRERSV
jgi:hypothetical protein